MQMRSAHSRMSLAAVLSRPVTFDMFSLFKSEKTSVAGAASGLLSSSSTKTPISR